MLRDSLVLAVLAAFAMCGIQGCKRDRADEQLAEANAQRALAQRHNPAALPEMRVTQVPPGARISVDGKLDEPVWANAASTGELVNVGTGAKNTSKELGGSVRLLWTMSALYLGIEIRDSDIRGDFEKGAVDPHLWTESTAEVMIDPDGEGDNNDYYEIQIGPQDLVFDSRFDKYNQPRVLPNGPFGHEEWSAQAKHAVALRGTLNDSSDKDLGYTLEAEIPWVVFDKAKTVPPKFGDTWRMNFYAMRSNGGVAWSPILGEGNFHKASRFGRVLWSH